MTAPMTVFLTAGKWKDRKDSMEFAPGKKWQNHGKKQCFDNEIICSEQVLEGTHLR